MSEELQQYKITYLLPAWFECFFEAPAGLTQEEAWDYMVEHKHYQEGRECGWSRGPEWWDEEIRESEAECIRNESTSEVLYQIG